MREWLARLRDRLRRNRLDQELAEELRFHREQIERESRDDAPEPDVRHRLGNLTRYREEARDRWSFRWLEELEQDVRHAWRGLRRSPGFTATVVLTLGLGLGANAAMFGVIDRLMFRPGTYLRDPSRVHRVYLRWNERTQVSTVSGGIEYTTYLDLRRWSGGHDLFAAFTHGRLAVGTGDATREMLVASVSASFFDFFDAPPVMGRYFGPAEDSVPRGAPVAVLSHAYWKSEFGGRDVLGEVIQVRNIPATVIGVAPEGFNGVMDEGPPALYIPITTNAGYSEYQSDPTNYYTRYNWGWISIMARRGPGVSREEASAELSNGFLRSWNTAHALDPESTPSEIARPSAIAGPLQLWAGPNAGLEARTLRWVSGVAVIVLLIAAANVANLMLARVMYRRREVAVRLALGVSRWRLLRSYLTEGVILAALGGVIGIAMAQWGGAALRGLFLQPGSSLAVATDGRTLLVVGLFALAVGVITGMGPAVLAMREQDAATLKTGPRAGAQRSRLRTVLLITQAALSVVLLVGAGLFVKSLQRVRDLRMGYDPEPLVMAELMMRGTPVDSSARARLTRRLVETAAAIPGVRAAAAVSSIPFWSTSTTNLYVTGIDSVRRLGGFTLQTATPGYFTVTGTRILRGRPFTAADRGGTGRVVVVSESMARVLWPGREALGECMRIWADTMPCTTVIGIAEDAIQNRITEEQRFRYYLPLEQADPARGHTLLLRVEGDAQQALEPVRKALQPVMPGSAYVRVQAFGQVVENQRRSWRVGATMFVAFGALALIVAAVGLYGVIAYNVAQRMHELGVRIALGAQSRDVIRLVVFQGLRVVIIGLLIGGAFALYAGRWVEPLLFQLSARDPGTYGLVAGLLLLVALLASTIPAARATRADPNAALRSE